MLAATYFALYISVNRCEESDHVARMKVDKKVDWKKTNTEVSVTAEDWLCQPSGDEAGQSEEELEKVILSDSDQIPPFF